MTTTATTAARMIWPFSFSCHQPLLAERRRKPGGEAQSGKDRFFVVFGSLVRAAELPHDGSAGIACPPGRSIRPRASLRTSGRPRAAGTARLPSGRAIARDDGDRSVRRPVRSRRYRSPGRRGRPSSGTPNRPAEQGLDLEPEVVRIDVVPPKGLPVRPEDDLEGIDGHPCVPARDRSDLPDAWVSVERPFHLIGDRSELLQIVAKELDPGIEICPRLHARMISLGIEPEDADGQPRKPGGESDEFLLEGIRPGRSLDLRREADHEESVSRSDSGVISFSYPDSRILASNFRTMASIVSISVPARQCRVRPTSLSLEYQRKNSPTGTSARNHL